MKKEVSIVIPCAQLVDPITMVSIMSLVNYSTQNGIKIVDIGHTKGMMIDDARNQLAEQFLGTSVEWVLWLDSDMVFPKDTLVELFKTAEEKDTKMVTGVYYQRKGKNFPVLWSRGSTTESGHISGKGNKRADYNKYVGAFLFPHPDKQEPAIAHAAGFGCTLIHRSVFEVMDRPWFKFIQGVCSEDFYFFVNAKEAGFTLWYNPKPILGHIGDSPIITKADFHSKLGSSGLGVESLKDNVGLDSLNNSLKGEINEVSK